MFDDIKFYASKITIKSCWKVFSKMDSPARILHDSVVINLLKRLTGTVIEIGATKRRSLYQDSALNANMYIKSNYASQDKDILDLDATNMNLKDKVVDGIVCLNVLEHIYDVEAALNEFYRVLKPGGKLLISAPFMIRYHGAPCDYHRFTHSFWQEKLKKYKKIDIYQAGNKFATMANLFQGLRYVDGRGVYGTCLMRMVSACFFYLSQFFQQTDEYALQYIIWAEKSDSAATDPRGASQEVSSCGTNDIDNIMLTKRLLQLENKIMRNVNAIVNPLVKCINTLEKQISLANQDKSK